MKVTVLGAAGGIGQALALLLKTKLPQGSSLSLFDLAPVTPGVAKDLSHIPTSVSVSGFSGDDPKEALLGADIVLISAGVARKPGMDRSDLFKVNANIIKSLVESCAAHCPKALIGIITNPVNTTVPIAAEVLKNAGVYDPKRLFGVTTLDVIRAQTFVGELKGLDPETIEIDVIGGHSGTTILPLLSQIEGLSFSVAEIESLTYRIQNAGTEVVEAKAGGGSATLSMGFAAALFCLKLVKALQGEKQRVCAYVDNPAFDGGFFAQAIEVDANGVSAFIDYGTLSAYEDAALTAMYDTLSENIEQGRTFVKA